VIVGSTGRNSQFPLRIGQETKRENFLFDEASVYRRRIETNAVDSNLRQLELLVIGTQTARLGGSTGRLRLRVEPNQIPASREVGGRDRNTG